MTPLFSLTDARLPGWSPAVDDQFLEDKAGGWEMLLRPLVSIF